MLERRQRTVLLVEDDTCLREIIAELFESEGYQVIQSADASRALHLAETHLPDVILLDLTVPGRSALGVLESLKETAPTRDIPVLILSGYGMVLIEDHAPRADGVIEKPFDVEVLLEQVRRAASRVAT